MGNITLVSILPLLSAVCFASFGFSIFFTSNKTRIKVIFGSLCFATAIWQFSWFILFNTTDITVAHRLAVFGHVAILTLPALLFNLAFRLNDKKNLLVYFSVLVVWAIVLTLEVLLVNTDLIISGLHTYPWGLYPQAGPYHWLFIATVGIAMIGTIGVLVRDYKKATTFFRREQIKFVLIGLVFYNMAAVDFLTNYGFNIYPFGFIFLFFFLVSIWYAITQHKLMHITPVLSHSLLLTLLTTYALVCHELLNYLQLTPIHNTFVPWIYYELVLMFAMVVVSVVLVRAVKWFTNKALNQYISPVRIVQAVSEELSQTSSISYAGHVVGENMEHLLRAYIGITIVSNNIALELYRSPNANESFGVFDSDLSRQTRDFIQESPFAFTTNSISFSALPDGQLLEVVRELESKSIEIIVPLHHETGWIGYIAISKKYTGEQFNNREKEIMKIIQNPITNSLHKLLPINE